MVTHLLVVYSDVRSGSWQAESLKKVSQMDQPGSLLASASAKAPSGHMMATIVTKTIDDSRR